MDLKTGKIWRIQTDAAGSEQRTKLSSAGVRQGETLTDGLAGCQLSSRPAGCRVSPPFFDHLTAPPYAAQIAPT